MKVKDKPAEPERHDRAWNNRVPAGYTAADRLVHDVKILSLETVIRLIIRGGRS
jgi:hypothetical protein